MRLVDPQSQRWVIRHIYIIMALVGLIMLALIQPVGGYLAIRNQELSDKTSFDDPNFMYLHDGGDATVVTFMLFVAGSGLLSMSPVLAIGYLLIRRGVTFNSLKLRGANID